MFNRNRNDISSAGPRDINRTIMQVAAILIALGVLMKLYRVQTSRGDERAFGRIRREIRELDIPASGKDALQHVTTLAKDLSSRARDQMSASDAN
jgi:hypothetical protein